MPQSTRTPNKPRRRQARSTQEARRRTRTPKPLDVLVQVEVPQQALDEIEPTHRLDVLQRLATECLTCLDEVWDPEMLVASEVTTHPANRTRITARVVAPDGQGRAGSALDQAQALRAVQEVWSHRQQWWSKPLAEAAEPRLASRNSRKTRRAGRLDEKGPRRVPIKDDYDQAIETMEDHLRIAKTGLSLSLEALGHFTEQGAVPNGKKNQWEKHLQRAWDSLEKARAGIVQHHERVLAS